MARHINWLGKERMIEIDLQSSVTGQGRESLQSPLTVVAVIIIYAITHTDYTQYINTGNRSQACHHNVCSTTRSLASVL